MNGCAIVRSEFDSEIFGVEFFRVVGRDPGKIEAELRALPSGPVMVDAKVDADSFDLISCLNGAGFRKASTLVEFSTVPDADATPDPEQSANLILGNGDLDAHANGFRFQRFAQDDRIPKDSVVALMRNWITNSLAGRRKTLAIGRNFCTYTVEGGCLTIDLVSCLDTGQGMTGRLLGALHAEAKARGCREMHVTTEAENVSAMRAYTRAGFKPVRSWVAMHLVRSGDGIRP